MPWNYPFHNVLNPLTATVFAGNALVIKVGLRLRVVRFRGMVPQQHGAGSLATAEGRQPV